MKQLFLLTALGLVLIPGLTGCTSKPYNTTDHVTPGPDTLTYLYKATYSSDVTVPANPAIAQKVLQVWKAFETGRIEAMKSYFADTVIYEDASGMRFHGPSASLLAYATKDIEGLDSMRFDISMWQSMHVNDKNEDWVNIWSTERRYPKRGVPDTVLMQENWRVKNGVVVYFNQYTAKLPK